jgi:hypothetical protein
VSHQANLLDCSGLRIDLQGQAAEGDRDSTTEDSTQRNPLVRHGEEAQEPVGQSVGSTFDHCAVHCSRAGDRGVGRVEVEVGLRIAQVPVDCQFGGFDVALSTERTPFALDRDLQGTHIDHWRLRVAGPLTRRFDPFALAWLDPGLDVLGRRRRISGTSAVRLGHAIRCEQIGLTGCGIEGQAFGAVGIRQVDMDVTDAYVFARRKDTDYSLRASQSSVQQVMVVGLALDSAPVRASPRSHRTFLPPER